MTVSKRNIKILLTDKIAAKAAQMLRERGFAVESVPTLPREKLLQAIGDYRAIAVRSATRLDAEVIAQAKNLRLAVRGGVGLDNIDIAACSRAGISVANTPGANSIATAELTLALMLALARNVVPAHISVVRGEWNRSRFRGVELHRKILGLIGLGRVGREVARRARAFGMAILAYDPYLEDTAFEELDVHKATLNDIYRQADFISLHVPLDEQTRGLIGAEAIREMKPGVRIINCARGGLLDAAAVAQALQSGHIAGVGLDVYEQEPPPQDYPLIGLEKVISVPHLGAYSREAQDRVAEEIVNVITGFFENGHSPNIVNHSDLSK